jgi:hypothetical protein
VDALEEASGRLEVEIFAEQVARDVAQRIYDLKWEVRRSSARCRR